MPIHDWTRVFPGSFHDFHSSWITHIKEALNRGLLPKGYSAQAEQQAGDVVPDVITLRGQPRDEPQDGEPPHGVLLLDEAPPKVALRMDADEATSYAALRRTLVIRHRSTRVVVAMIEVLSPGNKDRAEHVERLVDKSVGALQQGIHLLLVDLYPANKWNPDGLHGAIWPIVGGGDFHLPPAKPLTAAAYLAERSPQAFVEPLAVGQTLPDMPLFLRDLRYILVPLESTYCAAYAGVPDYVQEIVEGHAPAESG